MEYECIGICTPDPQTGLCQGCGRPLVELEPAVPTAAETPSPQGAEAPATADGKAPCSSS